MHRKTLHHKAIVVYDVTKIAPCPRFETTSFQKGFTAKKAQVVVRLIELKSTTHMQQKWCTTTLELENEKSSPGDGEKRSNTVATLICRQSTFGLWIREKHC
ncbi:hypothetical protein TNCV_1871101 [Trichonephila clavipes]|nr:hypothetical protein TNCV_1871101 [Trichonephila clavipes]